MQIFIGFGFSALMCWPPKDINFILTTYLQNKNDYGMLAYMEAKVMIVIKWKNVHVDSSPQTCIQMVFLMFYSIWCW